MTATNAMTATTANAGELAHRPRAGHDEVPDLDSRARVAEFVRDFYRKVAMDDLLGPVFAGAHVDWSIHIPKLVDFWCGQLHGEPGYEGSPLRAHQSVHEHTPFTSAMYDRWLELFTETVDEGFAGPNTELAKARAHRMARALRRLMAELSSPPSPLSACPGTVHTAREGT